MAVIALFLVFFFFKQNPAYEMRISDGSSDVFSSDLDPRARRDRSPRIGARAGRDGPRERPREQTWAPASSARRFVINRFLNAAATSAITPSGLRFLAVRLTLASVPLGPGAIRAFVKGARSTHPGGLGAEGT